MVQHVRCYAQLSTTDDGVTGGAMIGAIGFYTKLAIELGFVIIAVALLWPSVLSYIIKQVSKALSHILIRCP